MHPDVLAQQQRHQLEVELHQPLGHALAAGLGHRLDPLAHPPEIGPILVPAIEIEQRSDLLRQRETQQIARVGDANFLERVEERLRRERLHQPFGLGRGKNQVALLARGQAVEKLEFLLERQVEKFFLPGVRHLLLLRRPICLRKIPLTSECDQVKLFFAAAACRRAIIPDSSSGCGYC